MTYYRLFVQGAIAVAAAGFLFLGPSFGETLRAPETNSRQLCTFRHGLCVGPKHVKVEPAQYAFVGVFVVDGKSIGTISETDDCQNMATITLDYISGRNSEWTVRAIASGKTGTCVAKFMGKETDGTKFGPGKLRVTVDP